MFRNPANAYPHPALQQNGNGLENSLERLWNSGMRPRPGRQGESGLGKEVHRSFVRACLAGLGSRSLRMTTLKNSVHGAPARLALTRDDRQEGEVTRAGVRAHRYGPATKVILNEDGGEAAPSE